MDSNCFAPDGDINNMSWRQAVACLPTWIARTCSQSKVFATSERH